MKRWKIKNNGQQTLQMMIMMMYGMQIDFESGFDFEMDHFLASHHLVIGDDK